MRISPQKLKDLTIRLSEKGKAAQQEKKARELKNPEVKRQCREAFAAWKKIPAAVRADLFEYKEFTSASDMLKKVAERRAGKMYVRHFQNLRAEVTELALNAKNEAEFMEAYNKINPNTK